jgi:hypothetical protein
VQSIRVGGRQRPADDAAPVVADEVEAVDAQAVGDAEDVGDQEIDGVLPGSAGSRRRRVSTLVGGDGAEARSGEAVEVRRPRLRVLGTGKTRSPRRTSVVR